MASPAFDIHPTAIISPGAVIGDGTSIGPYSIIGSNVVLGRNNRIGPHVVIEGNTSIGDENEIFQFASVGSRPQDLKYRGESSALIVGNKNLIREYVTLQPGTEGGGMKTVIGNGNLFMVSSHIGHDSSVGNDNVIANASAVAGHVTIGNRIILGGLSAVHQFVRIGDYAMLGGGSMVVQDIIPCGVGQGDRAHHCGINVVGMQRAGVSEDEIKEVKDLYKTIFHGKGTFKDKFEQAKAESKSRGLARSILDFIDSSSRGIAPRRGGGE